MWSKIKQFLALPRFDDEEKDLVTSLFNSVILILLGLSIAINVILPLFNPQANYLTSIFLFLVILVLFFFIRIGDFRSVQVSVVGLCLAMWVIFTLNSWTDEGLRNLASGSFFVLTIIAGLLIGGRGVILFGVLSIAGAFIIYAGETVGMVTVQSRGVSFTDWVKFTFIEVTVMYLVHFAVKHLIESLEKLRVSEHMLAERAEELASANQQLTKLAEAKDEFIANVSHELRSPITSMLMYEDLLLRRPDRLDQYLPILQRETTRLETLIEDILSFSQTQQGGIDLKVEIFDLNELVKEYVMDRAELAESRELELSFTEMAGLPEISGDRNLLGQSIGILLTNSLNYTPAGGNVEVSTASRYDDDCQWVGYVVRDTGPGISLDDQERIFSRFYRGKIGRHSGFSGTGLGLAIAKEIIERHNGSIEVHSDGIPGKGTTFKVWLPIVTHTSSENFR